MEKHITPEPILPAPGEQEIWKEHAVYTEYEISTFGNVRRKQTKYVLTNYKNSRGYATVHLRSGVGRKHGKNARIHILVADTFLEPKTEGQEIDHIDRNRMNNYYKNLRWVSHKENMENASKKRANPIFMNRPELVLIDKETNQLIKEFKNLQEVIDTMGLKARGIRDNIHKVKPAYTFGQFLTKKEYQEKFLEKLD